ncbi:TDP-N-acetylfucosamine:lipid II N-acetylfucosaminyltransferase [Flavobacterium cucumis]|uniref:4-alpha-L-fucosyltransferase glycosyl transferase group 56 n=1 Tax=Flavobacterium cucumis TaxID=416016 RepID=A0A1M7ZUH0_9FLAO|nr:TDP-N-acetylfucosamine:lipid II N-acetylfucosaminyltransferase [Flavobacterium cucumis]SHO72518.1 4-alpha-L-fucosyltransferase glycosyl transferase group 56 [Flavobacterium cucumis]
MQIKFIHIFDDDKFIDPTIKLFEEVIPEQSVYYVNKSKNTGFKYVKSSNVSRVDLSIQQEKRDLLQFINSDKSHVVFLHALESNKQSLVFEILPTIKKVWFIWGYDLYGNWPLLKKNIYQPSTKSLLNLKTDLKKNLIHNSLSFYLFQKRHLIKKFSRKGFHILNNAFDTSFYRAAQLMDYVVPVVPTEYSLIKKMNLKAQYAPFTYGCIEDLLGSKINESVSKQPNIIVGNSADPSNNHLEVLSELAKLDLHDRKVYVPLSYSGSLQYKEKVIEAGREFLGSNFFPLIDFMTLEEYNNILLSCGTLIFNHVRQQGVGNIITLGYLGATLFLNEESPVYSYYQSLEMKIFNVKDISSKLFYELNEQEEKSNKITFFDLYSRNAVHNKIKTLVQIVTH